MDERMEKRNSIQRSSQIPRQKRHDVVVDGWWSENGWEGCMDGWMDGCMVAWMDERMKEWINATRFKGRIKFHVTYYSAYRYCLGGGLIHRASRDCRDCSRDFRRGVRFGRNSYHHHSIPRFPIPGTSCCGRPAILPSRCPFPFTRRLYHYATSSGGTKRAGCGATVPPAVAKVIANPLTPIPDPLCSLAPYKARLTICNWVHDPS